MNAKSIKLSLTAMFSALTVIGAQIKVFIPFSPVPITMQTLFTYLSGFLLGGKLGALSQVIYVFLGLTGLPVFAKGGGMQYLLGPTGGYLIGFIFAAYFIGTMTELAEDPGFLNFLLFSSVGTAIIYFFGVSVLSYWVGGLYNALILGVLPFIPGDLLKIIFSSYIAYKTYPSISALLKRVH